MSGRLVLVGTPIGNLGDLSPRARSALSEADLIVAEDSRVARKLCVLSGIAARSIRSYQGVGRITGEQVGDLLEGGATVALVSDAGMPGVSDPGAEFVGIAYGAGVPVEVVPGPSAVAAAVALWPETVASFCFLGFAPKRQQERKRFLADLLRSERLTVFFDSPNRVCSTLEELAGLEPGRMVLACRELTKLHEEASFLAAEQALAWARERPARGEWVLAVAPGEPRELLDFSFVIEKVAATRLGTKEAAELASALSDMPVKVAYAAILGLRGAAPV